MESAASLDGGPPRKPNVTSLWSLLQHGAAFNPDATALISPHQHSNHLSSLVRPISSSKYDDRWCGLGGWRLAKKWTSPYSVIGALISLFLPAPRRLDGIFWSFREMKNATLRISSFLDANGIQPGDTVLLITPSSAEWALMQWVCAFRCYTAVTMDDTFLRDDHEAGLLEHILQLSPSVIVVATTTEAANVDRLTLKRPFLGITLEKSEKFSMDGWTSLPEIATSSPVEGLDTKPSADSPDRVAMIIYTSGTSNLKPKACLRRVGELLGPFTIAKNVPPLTPPVALLNCKSYQATAPCSLFAAWYSGNAVALAGGLFDPETTISAAAIGRPLMMTLMVQICDRIRNHSDYSADKVKSLRAIQLLGSTITMASLRRAQSTFPKAKVSAAFGMTEAACMIGWKTGVPSLEAMPSYQGIAASGYVLPGAQIKIVSEDGDPVRRNEPGTLHLSGEMVSKGYLSGFSGHSFYETAGMRWFATTDCALMDDEGLVYGLGRCDSMVTRDGVTIAPATIENLLETEFPSTVVVVTVTTKGERTPYAVFDQLTEDERRIEHLVVQRLGSTYALGGIMDLRQLGLAEWPRNIAGKISTKDLEAAVAGHVKGCL